MPAATSGRLGVTLYEMVAGDAAVSGPERVRVDLGDTEPGAAAAAVPGAGGAGGGDRALPGEGAREALPAGGRGAGGAGGDPGGDGGSLGGVALPAGASAAGWRWRLRLVVICWPVLVGLDVGGLRERLTGRRPGAARSGWRCCRLRT